MEKGNPCRRAACSTETWASDSFCSDACRKLSAKDAEIERLKALVERAYFEGALTGWQSSTPNDWDIRPAWDESETKRALRVVK